MWNDPLPVPDEVRYLGRDAGMSTRERPTAVRVVSVAPKHERFLGSSLVDFGAVAQVRTPRGEVLGVFANELHLDAAAAARDFHDPPRLEDVERFPDTVTPAS